jgi:Niemann-Pick C2 protein
MLTIQYKRNKKDKEFGIPILFPIPNADGCKNSNLVCPLKSGQTYLYKDAIPVAASYPSVSIPIFYAWQ